MPHIRFNWVDVLFVTLAIRICYVGFKNGLLPEFFRLLGLLLAFVFSFNSYTILSQFIISHTKWAGTKPDAISFLSIFLLVLLAFKLLAVGANFILGRKENVSLPSRVIGLLLGIGRALLVTSLIYMFFINSPFSYLKKSAEQRSFSSQYITRIAPFAYKTGINFYPWEKIETPLVKLLNR